MTAQVPHILVVGGGYVGMYTAYGLRRAARKGRIRVTVVDPRSVMTYQPFLPEAAAGSVEPRHVVVPLRKTLKGCRVVTGRVTGIEGRKTFTEGTVHAGDRLCAEAEGLFIAIDFAKMVELRRMREERMGEGAER